MAGSASAVPNVILDVDFLEEMLADAQLLAWGGVNELGQTIEPERGIAGIGARKHLMDVKAKLDHARARAAEPAEGIGGLSESEFLSEFDERLRNLPLPYLERAVTEFLGRHPGARIVTE